MPKRSIFSFSHDVTDAWSKSQHVELDNFIRKRNIDTIRVLIEKNDMPEGVADSPSSFCQTWLGSSTGVALQRHRRGQGS